ncbi:methyl-accepting chemotaxis protein [Halobaculum sp. MBLA0147]|uniref:methyl-accepting chemotaxis protein n=1 Tax=Halobaculum sp. MBLA0147 TaxID=3079934 RepID=UPI0035261088
MSFTDVWRTVVPETIRRRFAAKLLLALLAVIGLTVGFGAFVQTQTAADLRADADAELTTTAEIRGETLDTWLSGVEKQTRLTSRHPAVTSGEADRVREHFRSLVGTDTVPEAVIAVHYYDTDAKVIRVSSASRLEGISPAEKGAPFARNPPTFEGPSDTYVSDPFSVPVVDHPVLTVISPVPGVEDRAVIYMIDLRQRVESLATVRQGSIVVVNDDGEFVSHPDTSRIGDRWTGMDAMRAAGGSSGSDVTAGTDTAGATFVERGDTLTAATTIEAADWTVVVRTPREVAYALGENVTSGILGLILLTMATLGLVGAVVGSDTVSSLRQIAVRANRMAEGDLDVTLETRREDEFADLAETFTEMRDSLRESLSEAETAREEAERARSEAEAQADRLARTAEEYETVMRAVADGDLTRRVDADADDEAMRAIGEAFNEMVADIERTLADVTAFSATVAEAVASTADSVAAVTEANEDVRASVSEIADGATQQAEDLATVESEMGQLSASAEEVASTVETVAATSRRAADAGDTGRERAEEALAEMEAIREQTEASTEAIETLESEVAEIAEIAELIGDIADQTNLLALNASIEAARAGGEAGDAGDGFAVVADEVKSLAEETKESAEEVESRIAAIRSHTEDTVAGMHETGDRVRDGTETVEAAIESLEEIVEHVEGVDDDIQEIASATEQQARSSEAVVDTVEEVASISEETSAEAATVDEATSRQTETLSRVADDADGLADRAERLQSLLANFEIDADGASEGATEPADTSGVRESRAADDTAVSDGGDRR